MSTILCQNCGGTGYIYIGEGSTLDENNYDNCPICDGYGVVNEDEDADEQ